MKLFDYLLLRAEAKVSNKERAHSCKTCGVFQRELERAHIKNDRLLDELLKSDVPQVQIPILKQPVSLPQFNQVPTSIRHWEQQRAILEAKDAEEHARNLAIKKQEEIDRLAKANSVPDLEKELGVEHA